MARVLNHNQQHGSPGTALKHYGKKGMKWGVRNEEKPTGGGPSSSGGKKKPEEPGSDDLKKAADAVYSKMSKADLQAEGNAKMKQQIATDYPPISAKRTSKAEKAEAEAAKFDKQAQEYRDKLASVEGQTGVKAAIQKSHYKMAVHDSEAYRDNALARAEQLRSGKLTTEQKMLIGAGALAAAAVVGSMGYRQYQLHQAGISKVDIKRETARNKAEHERQFNEIFGEHPGFHPVSNSEWAGGGFFAGIANKKALDRPEFEIAEGTVFQRLSYHKEDSTEYGINRPVYSTFLSNDKKIYGASSEFGSKAISVNFTAKGPTRVPSIATTLAHLKQVSVQASPSKKAYYDDPDKGHERLLYEYHQMAGGSWDSQTARDLFSSLKSFGYGAIVDDMDAGYLGDAPVVFFGDANPASHVERAPNAKMRDSIGMFKTSGKYA